MLNPFRLLQDKVKLVYRINELRDEIRRLEIENTDILEDIERIRGYWQMSKDKESKLVCENKELKKEISRLLDEVERARIRYYIE